MDFVALAVLLAILGAALAIGAGGFVAWAREEWRRMRADTWAPSAGTMQDPACQDLFIRQRRLAEQMRRVGKHLLAGKPYTPTLTKSPDNHPAALDNVVAMRRRPRLRPVGKE